MILYHGSTDLVDKPQIIESDVIWILVSDFILQHRLTRRSGGQKLKCEEKTST